MLLAVFASQGGCGVASCGPGVPDPCEQDRLGCEDPTELQHIDGCPDTSPLSVTVGDGENGFVALAPGTGPTMHYGFQGGQHYFLGFRVANASLDLYDQLKVTLWVGQGEACGLGAHPTGVLPEGCEHDLGYRELVIGSAEQPLNVVDGAVEESGLLLVVDYPWSGMSTVVAVEVEDPCGRTGATSVSWTQP